MVYWFPVCASTSGWKNILSTAEFLKRLLAVGLKGKKDEAPTGAAAISVPKLILEPFMCHSATCTLAWHHVIYSIFGKYPKSFFDSQTQGKRKNICEVTDWSKSSCHEYMVCASACQLAALISNELVFQLKGHKSQHRDVAETHWGIKSVRLRRVGQKEDKKLTFLNKSAFYCWPKDTQLKDLVDSSLTCLLGFLNIIIST